MENVMLILSLKCVYSVVFCLNDEWGREIFSLSLQVRTFLKS